MPFRIKNIGYCKNHRFCFCSFFVFFFLVAPGNCLSAGGKDVSMSVTIIDPDRCYSKIIAAPEKVVTGGQFAGMMNREVEGMFFFVEHDAAWNDQDCLHDFKEQSLSANGATDFVEHRGICGQVGDAIYKTKKHLAKRIYDVHMNGSVELDFTDGGEEYLKAGDINSEYGDNKINALDMSILVNDWNKAVVRADLNNDEEVNSLDSSILLANFNLTGD